MFCPVCKAEYRKGFTRCSDCDVDLVETLAAANAAPATREQAPDAVLLWSGTDPQTFSAVRDALDWARIFHFAQTRDSGVFPNLKGQPYSVHVNRVDLKVAEEVLETIPGVDVNDVPDDDDDEAEVTPDSAELAEEEDSGPVPDDIPEDFQPEKARAEIWSGDDNNMAETVRMCLRENGIGCVVDVSTGTCRIRVMPESEARAKEIVREILEGTPL
jgi:hypothetical protein